MPPAAASRGHPASILNVFGPGACALRLPIRAWLEWGGLAGSFTVSRRSRRQGLRVPCMLASWQTSSTPDCCAAPYWRRFRAIPPEQPEYDHVATFLFLVRFHAAGA